MKLFECNKESSGMFWKVVGVVGLAALAAGVIMNLPDIRRYIKITTM